MARVLAFGIATTAIAAAFELACGGPNSHVLSGRRYLADRDCVESRSSVDVVEGPDPGSDCPAVCLVGRSPLLEEPAVYVTTQCPPYPPTFDWSGENPACAGALAALERMDICTADGSTNPRDGGDDGDVDATSPSDGGEPTSDASEPSDASESFDAGDASEPNDASDASDASEPNDASDAE